jgi:hypothetical protein
MTSGQFIIYVPNDGKLRAFFWGAYVGKKAIPSSELQPKYLRFYGYVFNIPCFSYLEIRRGLHEKCRMVCAFHSYRILSDMVTSSPLIGSAT